MTGTLEQRHQSEVADVVKHQWNERVKWWFDATAFWKQRRQIVADPSVVWRTDADRVSNWKSPVGFLAQALLFATLAVHGVTVLTHKILKSPERSLLTWVETSDNEMNIASIKQPVGESPLATTLLLIDNDTRALKDQITKMTFSYAATKFKEPFPYSDKYILGMDPVKGAVLFTLGESIRKEVPRDDAIKLTISEIERLALARRNFERVMLAQQAGQGIATTFAPFSVIIAAFVFQRLLKKRSGIPSAMVDELRRLYIYSSAAEFFVVNLCVATLVSIQTLVAWYAEHPSRSVSFGIAAGWSILMIWSVILLVRVARKWERALGMPAPRRWFTLYSGRRRILIDAAIAQVVATVASFIVTIPLAVAYAYGITGLEGLKL